MILDALFLDHNQVLTSSLCSTLSLTTSILGLARKKQVSVKI
jgi:hypothetical protein